ncbi:MAG: BspA family leucine-rich repeat surface protein [Clostridiales bacterium]|uniref:BspA family leucine-rich repeat surface protein n=1 Tax=Terrisporobacter sp. TaxID=1965305 RepID=UPI002A56BA56|nr:BspA family leucine-rich repeat surface protein [Terrisporobacter sp.]MDD7756079.1 BspA family leucine-rich repeat surface protein [Clostridiales bacterium]MDY4135280.1 BspA family leucine-rich repeat surface protein [Terrisporobacter sp.]
MFKLKLINKPKMIKLKCGFSFPNIVLANLQEKEIIPTKNIQNIVADFSFDGLSKVTVNPIPDEYIIPSGEIEINANGNYNVTDKVSARVSVPEKTLTTKTITANGTYNATDDNADGYSQVTVETEKYAPRYIRFQSYAGTELDYELNNLDGKHLTSTYYMFQRCKGLVSVPLFDTSNVTDMSYMFNDCQSLVSVPLFDTSNVTDMTEMFGHCPNLVSLPLFDTSKVTNMNRTFGQCTKLTEIPLFDTRNVTNMSDLFYDCRKLQEIPALNTSNATNVNEMFMSCTNLKTVPQLNFSKVTNVSRIFYYMRSIVNLGGFLNLGNAYAPNQSANNSFYTLDLSTQDNITHDSLMNVINNLYDIATKGVKTQQLVLGSTNISKLSAEELQICTERGWSVS